MMHDPVRPARWHALGCRCSDCFDHDHPGTARWSRADAWAFQVLGGFATGTALVVLLAATGAGPLIARALGLL